MNSLNLDNIFYSNKNANNETDTMLNNKNNKMVMFTFYITYAFLITTGTITFIEALRTENPKIRHILNLETCISLVAAFFYGVFMTKINTEGKYINYKDININRYVDWSITTPIMLLVLLLAFCYNNGKSVTLGSLLIIFALNYGMLLFGFLGESGKFDKVKGNIIGFVFFIAMYGYIYMQHIYGYNIFDNNILYSAFVILWAMYGVVYFMKEQTKNIGYNILDLWSKCFVGIFFWAYFTKTIVLG